MTDTAAIDALAGLFRLPGWRINESRAEFVKAAAGILREVRDLAGPPAAEFLREHGWTYDAENDSFCPLDLERAEYMDCDFCDRLFRPNAAGKYGESPALMAHLTTPRIRTRGGSRKKYVTSAGPGYRQTGRLPGLDRKRRIRAQE